MTGDDPDLVRLRANDGNGAGREVTVEIDLRAGGRVAQISIDDHGEHAELLVPPGDRSPTSTHWGSFPMAPWAGRIRDGRFRFLGDEIQLETNEVGHDSGIARSHAIHGTTFAARWEPIALAADHIEMTCRIDTALGWPMPGLARQVITVHADRAEFVLAVEPDPGAVFPAAIGWHPWFTKPDAMEFFPLAMWARDAAGLPSGELVAPDGSAWDDCFVNRSPVTLIYDRPVAPRVTVASSNCEHWVIYNLPSHATCIEPQSGPPDAMNVRPELATSDTPLRRTMTVMW